jgi:hypothetical protein
MRRPSARVRLRVQAARNALPRRLVAALLKVKNPDAPAVWRLEQEDWT